MVVEHLWKDLLTLKQQRNMFALGRDGKSNEGFKMNVLSRQIDPSVYLLLVERQHFQQQL